MATKSAQREPKKHSESQEKPVVLIAREPEPRCRRCGRWCTCSEEELDAGGPA